MALWFYISLILFIIYFINSYLFSYWSNRGVPFKKPSFFLGELGKIIVGSKSIGEFFVSVYENFKQHKIIGLYFSYRPTLMINDPLLVQDVLIKSFTSFHDRNNTIDEKIDPLTAHLFSLTGQRWRDLRVKLSPTFTSGKLKGMYPTIRDCAQTLQDYVEKNVQNGNDIFDIRDLMARFTTSVISSVAFGIENDCINDRENVFRKMGLKIISRSYREMWPIIVDFFLPRLLVKMNVRVKRVPEDVEAFFTDVVKQTIDYREKNKDFGRKDFMQLLIQLKNYGFVAADKEHANDMKITENGQTHDKKKLTFDEVAAQSFLFFVAGFETSSSTSNFCLLELAKHPEIQKKVHEEIDRVLATAEIKEITYDLLGEMKYLDCCIDEALRLYPILPTLFRECSKDHKFPGTDWVVEKGTMVIIPAMGLQRDPNIYDCPLEFRPERFLDSPTGNGKSKGLFYLPFGDGPRNCIGARMGKIQTKLGLAMILSKFTFELVDKDLMHKNLKYKKGTIILTPSTDINLKAIAR